MQANERLFSSQGGILQQTFVQPRMGEICVSQFVRGRGQVKGFTSSQQEKRSSHSAIVCKGPEDSHTASLRDRPPDGHLELKRTTGPAVGAPDPNP